MLCELGHEAEIIDWRFPYFEWLYHSAWRMYRNPIAAIKYLISFLQSQRSVRTSFDRFRERMPMSRVISDQAELTKLNDVYDVFIAGSDQIWNPINSSIDGKSFDRACFLNFVFDGKKKNAYAASIGVDSFDHPALIAEYKALLSTFNQITMRENAGALWVGKLLGSTPDVVLDPVLLHDATFWNTYAAPIETSITEPYLLVYNVRSSLELKEMARQTALKKNLKIIDVHVPGSASLSFFRDDDKTYVGPEEFLTLIANATCVFTNSFHATAFSLLFHRDLYLQTTLDKKSTASRMTTLLGLTEVDQFTQEYLKTSKFVIQHFYDVDWERSDMLLSVARSASLKILKGFFK